MSFCLRFHPAFEQDVADMTNFIAEWAGEAAALSAADRADQALAALADRPLTGAPRDPILPGLRIAVFPRSGVIPYLVDETRHEVRVLGLFYGGQEWTRHVLARQ